MSVHSAITCTQCTPNQVAEDDQLLHTARDYFHFATNFLELINVSATHIYHSALELSPLSSVVRKCYYHQRPHASPRVVIGTSDSWKPSTAVSTKHSHYLSSTWSSCGQFVAVVAEKAVEIWDALTLKLISTMQSPTDATRFKRGIAYSPDRSSLAGCSGNAIIIWDTKTGGIVRQIKCRESHGGLELVWSLDGNTIGTVSSKDSKTMVALYTVASEAVLFSEELQSDNIPCLWAYGKYFQIVTTENNKSNVVNLFEVGTTISKIKSFPLKFHCTCGPFSPATHQISILIPKSHDHHPELMILDIHTSKILLQIEGVYHDLSFSHNGIFFAAFTRDSLSVWKYCSSGYIQWRKVEQSPIRLQFSPNLSSIFGYGGPMLHILRLDYPTTVPTTEYAITAHIKPLDAFSPHGTFIATTHYEQSTIAITNLNSLNPFPFQFIDTDMRILEIVLTGNVLLVKSSEKIVGWLLTEEGAVDGIVGNSRADQNDSLLNLSLQDHLLPHKQLSDSRLEFAVKDEIAAIMQDGFAILVCHTRTGEIIRPANEPQYSGRTWYRFNHPLNRSDCNLYHHKSNELFKWNWPVSQTTLQEGWVKDPEGKHRLWLYPYWRLAGNEVDWLNKTTTLRIRNSSELVVIKF